MAKVTGVVASQLQKDADMNGGDFNSRPYYRMFLGLICSLPPSDPTDGNAFGLVAAIANTLALVQVTCLSLHDACCTAHVYYIIGNQQGYCMQNVCCCLSDMCRTVGVSSCARV